MKEDDNSNVEDDLKAKEVDDHVEDSSSNMDTSSKKPGIDHFNNEESDPLKTNAMSKSFVHVIPCLTVT